MGNGGMEQQKQSRPPELMEKIVRLLAPPASREHVMGDLSERYRSPGQYLTEALRSLPFIIVSQIRRSSNLARSAIGAYALFLMLNARTEHNWLSAALPTLVAMIALVLRDAYRAPSEASVVTRRPGLLAALDVGAIVVCVALSQAVIALLEPGLLLPQPALLIQFPIFCVLLFFLRYQSPGGALWPPASTNPMSTTELVAEIRGLQGTWRRAIRLEIVASAGVAVVCVVFLRATPVGRLGGALTAAGALFIGGFLYRYMRVTPIPEGLGFAQIVTFYRQMLERHSRRTRNFIWWYFLALVPGPLALILGAALQQPNPLPLLIKALAGAAVMCVLIGQMNSAGRRRIERRIGQLRTIAEKA
jgi:hypothetical protein